MQNRTDAYTYQIINHLSRRSKTGRDQIRQIVDNAEKYIVCKNQKEFFKKISLGQEKKRCTDDDKGYEKQQLYLLIHIAIIYKRQTNA